MGNINEYVAVEKRLRRLIEITFFNIVVRWESHSGENDDDSDDDIYGMKPHH